MLPFRHFLFVLALGVVVLFGVAAAPSQASASPSMPSRDAEGIGLSRSEMWARWNALRDDAYELDSVERFIETPRRRVECSREGLVVYRGESLRYHGPLSVNPAFRERLQRFEQVVAEVAREVYGREPRRIRHYGAYSCRTSRGRSHRLSEHALGNAVDIVGFDFGPASKMVPLPAALPAGLKGPFDVRVAKHVAPWRYARL